MPLTFRVKQPTNQTPVTLDQLLTDSMSYGAFENEFCLTEGAIGNVTVVFDKHSLGRGIEVEITDESITFGLPVPSTESDVELVHDLLEKALECTGADEYEFEDIPGPLSQKSRDGVKKLQKMWLKSLESKLMEDGESEIIIYGAIHAIALDENDLKIIGNDWQKYESYLHELQSRDLYFARPTLVRANEGIIGIYNLTAGVASSFPLKPNYLISEDRFNVSRWLVSFYDPEAEDIMGLISFDNFMRNTSTVERFDAARFVVKKELGEMQSLVTQCGEEL